MLEAEGIESGYHGVTVIKGIDLSVGHDAVHQALLFRLRGIEDRALEQNLQHRRRPHDLQQRLHLFIGDDRAQPVDRNAEARAVAAYPQVAASHDFKPSTHAWPLDQGNDGMRASADSSKPGMHDLAVRPRRLDVRS